SRAARNSPRSRSASRSERSPRTRSPTLRDPYATARSFARELLYRDLLVRVDADLGGDAHCFLGDRAGVEVGVLDEGARGGEGEVAAGADRAEAVLGLDDVAGAGHDEGRLAVGGDEQRLEAAEEAV